MVLYRKYRPQKFIDIVGQNHVTRTLSNSLASGNFSHGYLFSGPRGSGKTTIARILAKALNCTGRELGKDSFEPCQKCASCKEINAGKSLDIIEIDAASNRGIDEIRELRDKIRFAPTSSRYKVYIIDEVHMLTKEAFNALLKTLEEPPKHAVFLLATTEPQKVLPTILSRVQRFDFHKATIEEIETLLSRVAKSEKLKIQDEAMKLLAQLSFGAYRDSLSLLDQVSSTAEVGMEITVEKVQELLGLGSDESIFLFAESLARKDRAAAFKLISELYFQGVDLEHFTTKFIEILRKIALLKLGENQLFDLTKEQQEKVKILAGQFEINDLMAMIEKFILSIPKIKSANLPQLPLEMLVYEITTSGSEDQISNIKNQKEETLTKSQEKTPNNQVGESDVLEVNRGGRAQGQGEPERLGPISSLGKSSPVSSTNIGEPKSETFNVNLWPEVVKETKVHNNSLAAMLSDAAISEAADDKITLAFKFKFHSDVIAKKTNTKVIEEIIEKVCGTRYVLSCVADPNLKIKKPVDKEEALIEDISEVFELE